MAGKKGTPQRRDRSTVTKGDLIRFIEWAVERAGEELPRSSGTLSSFLATVEVDGRALLRRVRP